MTLTVFDMDNRRCAEDLAAEAEERLKKYGIDTEDWGYIVSRIETLKTIAIDLEEGLEELQIAARVLYDDQGRLAENARYALVAKQAQRKKLIPELTPEKLAKIARYVWGTPDGEPKTNLGEENLK